MLPFSLPEETTLVTCRQRKGSCSRAWRLVRFPRSQMSPVRGRRACSVVSDCDTHIAAQPVPQRPPQPLPPRALCTKCITFQESASVLNSSHPHPVRRGAVCKQGAGCTAAPPLPQSLHSCLAPRVHLLRAGSTDFLLLTSSCG